MTSTLAVAIAACAASATASAQTVIDLSLPIYNVANAGVGPLNDDANGVRMALQDAMATAGDVIVRFPQGQYDFFSTESGSNFALGIGPGFVPAPGTYMPSRLTIEGLGTGANIVLRNPGMRKRGLLYAGDIDGLTLDNLTLVGTDYLINHQTIPSSDGAEVGDHIVFAFGGMGASALRFEHVSDGELLDVTVHAIPHMAFQLRDTKDFLVDGVRIVPGPTPLAGTAQRLFSAGRGGIHFLSHRGALVVKNCELVSNGDDGVIVHGFFSNLIQQLSLLQQTTGNDWIGVNLESGDYSSPQVGDELRFFDFTTAGQGGSYVTRTVLQVTSGASVPVGVNPCDYLIQLNRAYSVPTGSPSDVRVENRNTVGSGCIIEDNTMSLTQGRSIYVKCSDVTIRRNSTSYTVGPGITVPSVAAISGSGDSGVALNVLIEDNVITDSHGPNLMISNARTVLVKKNAFLNVNHNDAGPAGAANFGFRIRGNSQCP